jgi:hypothetical protein
MRVGFRATAELWYVSLGRQVGNGEGRGDDEGISSSACGGCGNVDGLSV